MTRHAFYDMVLNLTDRIVKLSCTKFVARRFPKNKKSKFILGQHDISHKVNETSFPDNTIWFHASSLGELAVLRPIIKKIRANGYHAVLTFFSPTGVEATSGHLNTRYEDADNIFYLPIDTKKNAHNFIEKVRPLLVVFAISEIWPNYLFELRRKNIPTFLVSAKINPSSALARWYGGIFRDAYKCFTYISCLDEKSSQILHKYNINNVSVTGDPLFDNAVVTSQKEYTNNIVERFCADSRVFIAGSIHDKNDLDMVSYVANKNRNDKFIFVPHEISEEILNAIKYHINGKCLLYSECDSNTDLNDVQVLVIDFLGALAQLYRYCDYAYVGGGFTPFLHSVIEATVFGLPVAFGPRIERKTTPLQLVQLGIGTIVKNGKELNNWYQSLRNDTNALEIIKDKAKLYTDHNTGATDSIIQMIKGHDKNAL